MPSPLPLKVVDTPPKPLEQLYGFALLRAVVADHEARNKPWNRPQLAVIAGGRSSD